LSFLTWYEWLLSFRFYVERKPDLFDSLLDGFLVNEATEMGTFCSYYLRNQSLDTIIVKDQNKSYKVCRKCPHAGHDLVNSNIENGKLICPKHHWAFDLKKGGICEEHGATINAVEISE
jgi:UDP-MurNAc hydroxylase